MNFKIEFYKTGNKNPIMDFILSLDEDTQLDIFALLKRMEDDPFTLGSMSKKNKRSKKFI